MVNQKCPKQSKPCSLMPPQQKERRRSPPLRESLCLDDLDEWIATAVFSPLFYAHEQYLTAHDQEADTEEHLQFHKTTGQVRNAIRQKVIQSFLAGQRSTTSFSAIGYAPRNRRTL